MLRFNRDKFAAEMHRHFDVRLQAHQISGLAALLKSMEADPELSDIRVAAYLLATAWHETAMTMQPICERGPRRYFEKRYDPVLGSSPWRRRRAKRMGNTKRGDGYRYRGRGYVQLTWKCNYQRATDELAIDFVEDPDLALGPENAYLLLSRGLLHGWFTGKRLGRYIGNGRCDYRNARRTVNGTDRADDIAHYARAFEECLDAASIEEDSI